jgi:chromate reductase
VRRLKNEIAAAQGLIFVPPEDNRSMPGVLKNAIDHASRPYGQNGLGRQAGRRDRHLGRLDHRYRHGAATSTHCARLLDVPTLGQPEAVAASVTDDHFDADGAVATPAAARSSWAAWIGTSSA